MTQSDKETLKSVPNNGNDESRKEDSVDAVDPSEAQGNASFFSDEEGAQTVVGEAPTDQASESKISQIEAQAAEWKDKVVYLSAEIENMRKRFAREKSELLKMASEEVLKSLLPVFDNMTYALKAAKDNESKAGESTPVVGKLIQGVEMTLKHFEQTLEQLGVTQIKAVGNAFDPSQHEAAGQSEVPEYGNDVVSTELQKGFKLYNRVIRPARVLVNKK